VAIFSSGQSRELSKVGVGARPNGLAFDPARGLLLAATVGNPASSNPPTISMVDIKEKRMTASIVAPGRTRWTVYDKRTEAFYVNIVEPARIAVIDADDPGAISRFFEVSAHGPHGLDLDTERMLLYCACDQGVVLTVDTRSGKTVGQVDLSGAPDVVFYNRGLGHLYVANGDPGAIDVIDTERMTRVETVPTEKGAHTIAFDEERNRVFAFLPQTHRAALYVDP